MQNRQNTKKRMTKRSAQDLLDLTDDDIKDNWREWRRATFHVQRMVAKVWEADGGQPDCGSDVGPITIDGKESNVKTLTECVALVRQPDAWAEQTRIDVCVLQGQPGCCGKRSPGGAEGFVLKECSQTRVCAECFARQPFGAVEEFIREHFPFVDDDLSDVSSVSDDYEDADDEVEAEKH